MDGIGSAIDPRRTDEILRRAAEDAGQTAEPHYNALGPSFQQKKADFETDKTNVGAAKKLGGLGIAKLVGATLSDKLDAATDLAAANLATYAPALRMASAGNAISGVIGMSYELMKEGYFQAHARGDALRSTSNNDAMMVGLSQALDAPTGFKAAVARMRPETATQGGAAIAAQFMGKDKDSVPLLQHRADDGLTRAKPWAEKIAAAKTPEDQKKILEDFNKSPVGLTAAQDAAFGMGVSQALWAVGGKGRGELTPSEYDAMFNKANARLDPSRPATLVQG